MKLTGQMIHEAAGHVSPNPYKTWEDVSPLGKQHYEIMANYLNTELTFNEIHALLGGDKDALRASIERTAQQRGDTVEEEMERLLKHLRQTA